MLVAVERLTTLTLFRYPKSARAWALVAMGRHRGALARTPGLLFWRLLGCGVGPAFSLEPDLERYALLAVWETPAAADAFLDDSPCMRAQRARAVEEWTVRLSPAVAHGSWGGENPFLPTTARLRPGRPLAVITRATLRLGAMRSFWRSAHVATEALSRAEGCLASVGIGELPFVRLGTFSLWRSDEDVRRYAYGAAAHRQAMKARAAGRWYREELFARFVPLSSTGTWDGRDPLRGAGGV